MLNENGSRNKIADSSDCNFDKENSKVATDSWTEIDFAIPPELKLTKFSLDTPFTESGKSHGPINEQFKRRTILTTEISLPNVSSRALVVNRSYVIIRPIDCVIEDIEKRIRTLRSEAAPMTGEPALKTLSQVLSGCVNTQVNGGIKEVVEVFLAVGNPIRPDEEHSLMTLKQKLLIFLKVAGQAIAVSLSLCKEQNEFLFHEVLNEGYETLSALIPHAITLHDEWTKEYCESIDKQSRRRRSHHYAI
jgi:hypothetical protein